MSRSLNKKRSGYYGPKQAFKFGTKKKNRSRTRILISKIIKGADVDNISFNKYERQEDWWSYD